MEEGNKAGIILSSEAAQQDSVNRAVGEHNSTSVLVLVMLSRGYCSMSLVHEAAQLGDAVHAIHKQLQWTAAMPSISYHSPMWRLLLHAASK